jgi:hypothetical protein
MREGGGVARIFLLSYHALSLSLSLSPLPRTIRTTTMMMLLMLVVRSGGGGGDDDLMHHLMPRRRRRLVDDATNPNVGPGTIPFEALRLGQSQCRLPLQILHFFIVHRGRVYDMSKKWGEYNEYPYISIDE